MDGMPILSLHDVYMATVMAKLLYSKQVWSGFCDFMAVIIKIGTYNIQ